MNGEPLPFEHGFPVRMVVPGLYGYVSATKWIVDFEVTRFADFSAYWTDRGWAVEAPIKTASRIDVPKAFATHQGRTGGRGRRRLGAAPRHRQGRGPGRRRPLAARRRSPPRTPSTPGGSGRSAGTPPLATHKLTVRATDADGNVQTADRPLRRARTAPSGLHNTVVMVE